MPFFFLLTSRTEEGGRAPAPALAGGPGHGSGRVGGEMGQAGAGYRFPASILEERARREGRDGHGHGGQAVAMGSVGRGG